MLLVTSSNGLQPTCDGLHLVVSLRCGVNSSTLTGSNRHEKCPVGDVSQSFFLTVHSVIFSKTLRRAFHEASTSCAYIHVQLTCWPLSGVNDKLAIPESVTPLESAIERVDPRIGLCLLFLCTDSRHTPVRLFRDTFGKPQSDYF